MTNITPPRDGTEQPQTITLFLQADEDFKGVSFQAEYVDDDGDGGFLDAGERDYFWIPWWKEKCGPYIGGAWYEFRLRVWVEKFYYVHRFLETVPVRVDYTKCISLCQRSGFWDMENLQLVAHGPSRWKFERPNDTCGAIMGILKDINWNPPFQTCHSQTPPPDTPLNTSSPPVTPTIPASSTAPPADTDTTPTIPLFAVVLAVAVLSAAVL